MRILGSRWAIALMAAVATAGVVGGVSYAVADAAGGGSTFYACSNSTGTVRASTIRVNSPPTSCPTGYAVTSWNAVGPTGAQGPVGQASVVALAPAAALNCPTPPAPSGDPTAGAAGFLDVPNIPGESTDSRHAGQIDVLSWSWGASASASGRASCGAGQGSTGGGSGSTLNDVTIVKRLDKASPKLMLAVVTGQHLGTITLSLSKGGTDYLVITLENAVASNFQSLGTNGAEIPRDQVTFNATKVTMQYQAQSADGTFQSPIITCFDLVIQQAC